MPSNLKMKNRRLGANPRRPRKDEDASEKFETRGSGVVLSRIRALRNRPVENPVARWLAVIEALPVEENRKALLSLLWTLNQDQLRQLVQEILPEFRNDTMSSIPRSAMIAILGNLHVDQILRVGGVSREWSDMAHANPVWEEKCHAIGIYELAPGVAANHPEAWKKTYMIRYFIPARTWEAGRPSNMREVPYGDHGPVLLMKATDNRIVTVTKDRAVLFFDLETGDLINTHETHRRLMTLRTATNFAVTGVDEAEILVFDAVAGELRNILEGPFDVGSGINLIGNRMVVATLTGSLQMWDLNQNAIVYEDGRGTQVNCVASNGQIIATGDLHGKIFVRFVNEPTRAVKVIDNNFGPVCWMRVIDDLLLVAGIDISFRVYNAITLSFSHIVRVPGWAPSRHHHPSLPKFKLQGEILAASTGSLFILFNYRSGQYLFVLKGHKDRVQDIGINSHSIVTSSVDGYVKLWDRFTGRFLRNLMSPAIQREPGSTLPSYDACYRLFVDDHKLIVSAKMGDVHRVLFINFKPSPDLLRRTCMPAEPLNEEDEDLQVLEFGKPAKL